jgi:hypothetical protein
MAKNRQRSARRRSVGPRPKGQWQTGLLNSTTSYWGMKSAGSSTINSRNNVPVYNVSTTTQNPSRFPILTIQPSVAIVPGAKTPQIGAATLFEIELHLNPDVTTLTGLAQDSQLYVYWGLVKTKWDDGLAIFTLRDPADAIEAERDDWFFLDFETALCSYPAGSGAVPLAHWRKRIRRPITVHEGEQLEVVISAGSLTTSSMLQFQARWKSARVF